LRQPGLLASITRPEPSVVAGSVVPPFPPQFGGERDRGCLLPSLWAGALLATSQSGHSQPLPAMCRAQSTSRDPPGARSVTAGRSTCRQPSPAAVAFRTNSPCAPRPSAHVRDGSKSRPRVGRPTWSAHAGVVRVPWSVRPNALFRATSTFTLRFVLHTAASRPWQTTLCYRGPVREAIERCRLATTRTVWSASASW
jgi:hypothetical protein